MFTFTVKLLEKQINSQFDQDNGLILISSFRLNELKLKPGSWLKIWHPNDQKNFRYSKIDILDSDSNLDQFFVYLSPILWFNLRNQNEFTATLFDNVPFNLMAQLTVKPTLADHVQFALVKSCHYSHLNLYSNILEDYLHKERIFKEGDLIAVSPRSTVDYFEHVLEYFQFKWPVIYYKVIQIDNQSQVFSKSFTKWGVYSTLSSCLPPRIENYFSKSLNHFVLDSYVENLSSILMPYFTHLQKKVPTILISGPSSSGKQAICYKSALLWNMHFYFIDCGDVIGEGSVQTSKNLRSHLEKLINYKNCMIFFRNIDILFIDPDDSKVLNSINGILIDYYLTRDSDHTFSLIGSTSKPDLILNSEVGSLFNHHLLINLPNSQERLNFFKSFTRDFLIDSFHYDVLAKETKGFNFDELTTLLAKIKRKETSSGNTLDDSFDYKSVLNSMSKKKILSNAISIPNVDWSDIGGLEEAKKEITDIFQLPLEYPNLFQDGFRRCGILLYGPPGTGKTLLAKAVASQCMLNFLNVKGPELMSIYVGESEANVRDIFEKAIKLRPSVIFFDELDSIAPKRGKVGDSGGVMDRIVSQLVTEIDLLSSYKDVFIIGATNRPDLLDTALLIPGRFDRLVFIGPPKDVESRKSVLTALTKKFKLSKDVNLSEIETICPSNLTGADFYSICSFAMMQALNRSVEKIELGEVSEEMASIDVKLSDFIEAISNFTPSLSTKELEVYENIRKTMKSTNEEETF